MVTSANRALPQLCQYARGWNAAVILGTLGAIIFYFLSEHYQSKVRCTNENMCILW